MWYDGGMKWMVSSTDVKNFDYEKTYLGVGFLNTTNLSMDYIDLLDFRTCNYTSKEFISKGFSEPRIRWIK